MSKLFKIALVSIFAVFSFAAANVAGFYMELCWK